MTITINDIKKDLMKKLHSKYPDHFLYAEKIPQDFKKPSFFIYFVPVETQHNSRYYYTRTLLVKIDYYSGNEGSVMEDNWTVGEKLTSLFHQGLVVNGSHLNILRTNQEIIDDVMVFTLNLQYQNGIEFITVLDDEGIEHYVEPEIEKGYTEENIDLMRKLEME